MKKKEENKEIFGTEINNLGTAFTLEEFISFIKGIEADNESTLFYRGETKDYGATALVPQIFRVKEWLDNEHKMLNDFVAKFPDKFPKGTSTFEIMVYADHYGLPVRLLDITASAFTGLFMACFNYKGQTETSPENDAMVYIFQVKKKDIKNWNSDSVTLISNIARMDNNFLTDGKGKSENLSEADWVKWMQKMQHTIKDEKSDFYNMHPECKMSDYKNDLNKIVCVESKMINPRILNQKGLYFLFGINGGKSEYKNLQFDKDSVKIYSIKISGKSKPSLLKQLAICGCDKTTMFPEMENVCDAIKSIYGGYKQPLNIHYLVNEFKRKFEKEIEIISIDDAMAIVYYKKYVIILDKNHKLKITLCKSGIVKKDKVTLSLQVDDKSPDSKNSIVFLSRGMTDTSLDLCIGENEVSYKLSSDEPITIDKLFTSNAQPKCPDELEDILSFLLCIYKKIASK